jgi:hypothetical protein
VKRADSELLRPASFVEEAGDAFVEGVRTLEIGGMSGASGASDDVELGAGHEAVGFLDELRGRDGVLLADEEEDGDAQV